MTLITTKNIVPISLLLIFLLIFFCPSLQSVAIATDTAQAAQKSYSESDMQWINKFDNAIRYKAKPQQFLASYAAIARQSGLEYSANNAVALYNESINNPPNRRRYESDDIILAVNLYLKYYSHVSVAQESVKALANAFVAAGIPIDVPDGILTDTNSSTQEVSKLKTYSGNNSEFNAFSYYSRYSDLQDAIGPNGDALLKHYNDYGKAEGRIAN